MEELKEKTRRTLGRDLDPMAAMKLIDTLQWLGISYQYEEEIDFWLEKLQHWEAPEHDLQATAIRFRLLRQNARPVNSDIFTKFMVENQDKEGLLCLYEASYLGTNDEYILSKAMTFAEAELKSTARGTALPQHLSRLISRALELPRHMRMERLESRLYIDEYYNQNHPNDHLLKLAKSDYNHVQSLYQMELAEVSRWLKHLGLIDKLSFARNRPMECFLWTVGVFPHPKYSVVRIEMAKCIAILLVIDDIFDTYGTIEELALFTQTTKKWDLNAIEELPEYMKICFMALYNTTNEIAYHILKEQGRNVLQFLAKTWIDTIEAFFVEAEWFNNGQTPSVEDYLRNGVTTSGSYMALVFAFFLIGEGINEQNVKYMVKPYATIFSISGMILRLWDDLGTSKEEKDRGDNSSVVTLLMKEKNLSEDDAREHIIELIRTLWKDLNRELLGWSKFPLTLIHTCFNMSRTSQVIYQHQENSYFSNVDSFVDLILYNPIKN
ncbi:monoterpene synthase TPS4, chloroplastic-like [Andrographis paniculata]|uniref:monoterpene synthase TPS4, chloroplastic-like n=1 Tax=Andrographis paniculata TaxID=175694 RepID=UPI0021E8D4AA|nr:monoterpene synthase TPS4, chloroplastic-like [Andrographis paniculata]QJA18346.1 terpene synthase 31 [Andrographis paniculata]